MREAVRRGAVVIVRAGRGMKCPHCKRKMVYADVRIVGFDPLRHREGYQIACCKCGKETERAVPHPSLFPEDDL